MRFCKTLRTIILPIVGGLLVGGWLFLKWDEYWVKQVQLRLLLERTGLQLESIGESYRIVEYNYQDEWQDFSYGFKIKFENGAAANLLPAKTPWGEWRKESDQYEFNCTNPACYSGRIFGTYDLKTRELSLHQIYM